MRGHILVFLAMLIQGCNYTESDARYEFTSSQDGALYRLDTETGAVALVSPDGISLLEERIVQLKKNNYYEMEDGQEGDRFLLYIGNGQFEKRKYAVIEKP